MLPEVISAWKGLEGRNIEGRVHLDAFETTARVPVFAGHLDTGQPVSVRFFHEPEGSTAIFDRHREATFLSHPSLLPCLGTGNLTLDGERFVYGVYEAPNTTVAALLEGKAFSTDETSALCLDVLDGLEYLHNLGLVYCNLDKTTVARCGDRWKLCDYSELRPEGAGYSSETRRLLGALPGAPPEAYSGVVSPAWDAWSLAHLLRSLLADGQTVPVRNRDAANGVPHRSARPAELPEPYRSVAAECLLPDPGARCSTTDIRRRIESASPLPVVPVDTAARVEDAPLGEPLNPVEATDHGRMWPRAQVPVPLTNTADAEATRRTVPPPEAGPAPTLGPWDRLHGYRDPDPDPGDRSLGSFRTPPASRRLTPAAILVVAATVIALLLLVSNYMSSRNATGTTVATGGAATTPGAPDDPGQPREGEVNSRSRAGTTTPPATTPAASDVNRVVQQWADAFRQRNVEAEVSHYAPRVRRFFLSRNVSADFVRRTKQSAIDAAGEIRRYDISNLNTQFNGPNAATVTFDKTWEFAGRTNHTGKVRSELKLEKQNGAWKIVSERDLQVYRQNRARA